MKTRLVWSRRVESLIAFVSDQNHHRKDDERVVSSLKPFCCRLSMRWVVVLRSSVIASHVTRRVLSHFLNTPQRNSSSSMDAFNSRLQSFAKARRVKQSNTKRTVSLKWPHPTHFLATPDTLTEAGFFFNPSWDAQDNVECFFCGKCLDGWEEQDDPFAIHWDKCRDSCAWAVVRCGLSEDVDRKGKCVFPFHVALAHSLIALS